MVDRIWTVSATAVQGEMAGKKFVLTIDPKANTWIATGQHVREFMESTIGIHKYSVFSFLGSGQGLTLYNRRKEYQVFLKMFDFPKQGTTGSGSTPYCEQFNWKVLSTT